MNQILCFYLILFLSILTQTHCHKDDELKHILEENIESVHVEDNVYVLDDSNYDSFVSQYKVALVKFSASWCGHCKKLAPEYIKAAKILQNDTKRIVLAKVEGPDHLELMRRFEVTAYPTLFVYLNGSRREYDGPLTAEGIVDYMRMVADPNYQPPEESVITLTEDNFYSIVNQENLILVYFFVPWDKNHKRLKQEYERASRRLLKQETPIKLAKVDLSVQKELTKIFPSTVHSAMLLFRNGKKFSYKGPREENGIVSYMLQMQKFPSKAVHNKDQLRKEIQKDIPTVVGFFGSNSKQTDLFDLYTELAYDQFEENNHFVHVDDDQLVLDLKQKSNTLVVFKPLLYHSKYESNSNRIQLNNFTTKGEIAQFILNSSIPLVGYRNPKTYSLYANKYPLLVVYYDVDFSFDHQKQTQLIRKQVLIAASNLRKYSNITFVIANEHDNENELKDLKLDDSGEEVNVGYFLSAKKRFAMKPTEEFDSDVLVDFISNVHSGQLSPVIKSTFVPKNNPVENLWTVVGETFNSLVTDSKQDVLIEFYANWCQHCKALEPTYQKLAKSLEPEQSQIRVMKIEATLNDYPEWFEVTKFPTIYYIPHSDNRTLIPYEGDFSLEKLTEFVHSNLAKNNIHNKEEL